MIVNFAKINIDMKYIITLITLNLILLNSNAQSIFEKKTNDNFAYEINGEIAGLKDSSVILGYYFEDNQYAKDTAIVNNGKFTFTGFEPLKGGMYFVLLSESRIFDLIISEQFFSFSTKIDDLQGSMKFKNSVENPPFYEYINFISNVSQSAQNIIQKIEATSDKEQEEWKKKLENINNSVQDYQNSFIEKNINKFFAKVVKSTLQITPPPAPDNLNENEKQMFQLEYYKEEFLNNMDFSDERMIRTPQYIFYDKINQYLNKLTAQHPDSINAAADVLVEKARNNKEVFKYIVHHITSTYEQSKIMGMDAVFVHMVEKYYLTDQCYWVDSTQLVKIADRAKKIAPNLIGQLAEEFVDFYGTPFMKDTIENTYTLNQIKSKYTVLIFYGPTCGHCKKQIPKIKKEVDSLLEVGHDITTFAVATEFDRKEWIKFINDQKTWEWINVSDIRHDEEGNPVASSDWRDKYDIHSTPVVYLLDEKKRIIGKRVSPKQIGEIINNKEKTK